MNNIIFDIETLGLEPTENRIICISIKNAKTNNVITILSEDESQILNMFWYQVSDDDVLISFNGDRFDIPFIIKRSIINNVKCKKIQSLDLYKIVNGCQFSNEIFNRGTLSFWAHVLQIKTVTADGAFMREYFRKKEYNKIKDHCEEDVMITYELYKRLVECNLVDERRLLKNE